MRGNEAPSGGPSRWGAPAWSGRRALSIDRCGQQCAGIDGFRRLRGLDGRLDGYIGRDDLRSWGSRLALCPELADPPTHGDILGVKARGPPEALCARLPELGADQPLEATEEAVPSDAFHL